MPKNFKDKVQCLGYNLDTSQPCAIFEEDARAILEAAIRKISEPVSSESVHHRLSNVIINKKSKVYKSLQM